MSKTGPPEQFFIGWDVGGWNCDRNRESRDAIVILDAKREIIGTPWRGNLREAINEAETAHDWLLTLFKLCKAVIPEGKFSATLAIDTPLGFSDAFRNLVNDLKHVDWVGQSDTNPYLFRATEQILFQHELRPLSPIKDMIGSQATKGMHVLSKFAPTGLESGVWSDGEGLTAIEAYPSACKASDFMQKLLQPYVTAKRVDSSETIWIDLINHQDKLDALICALVAYAFKVQPEALQHPDATIPMAEGWIWMPLDVMKSISHRPVATT